MINPNGWRQKAVILRIDGGNHGEKAQQFDDGQISDLYFLSIAVTKFVENFDQRRFRDCPAVPGRIVNKANFWAFWPLEVCDGGSLMWPRHRRPG